VLKSYINDFSVFREELSQMLFIDIENKISDNKSSFLGFEELENNGDKS